MAARPVGNRLGDDGLKLLLGLASLLIRFAPLLLKPAGFGREAVDLLDFRNGKLVVLDGSAFVRAQPPHALPQIEFLSSQLLAPPRKIGLGRFA